MSLSQEDEKGLKIIASSILVVVIMFSLVAWLKYRKEYDETTLCPSNISYNSTVVIVDKSDPWKKKDSKKVEKLIRDVSSKLEKFERLTIRVLSSTSYNSSSELITVFDMCNPGSKANPLYENPRKILDKYKNTFKEPLDKLSNTLIKPGRSKDSPIFSAIYDSAKYNKGRNKHLIIISDLLENSKYFNFYKTIPTVKKVLEEYPLNDLEISKFTVMYIRRSRHGRNFLHKSERIFKNISNNIGAEYELERFISIH
jgi:hypothetical protein